MPILDPSLAFSLLRSYEKMESRFKRRFFLNFLSVASKNINRNLDTIKASIQFKKDLKNSCKFFNSTELCHTPNLFDEKDFNIPTMKNYYQFLFEKIMTINKKGIKNPNLNLYGNYKMCDKFKIQFFQPFVIYPDVHAWYLASTPIAILCINTYKFIYCSYIEQFFELVNLEIDLMVASGYSIVLCLDVNPFCITSENSEENENMVNHLIYLISQHPFSEIHFNIFPDWEQVKNLIEINTPLIFDSLISKIYDVSTNNQIHGYFYLYSSFHGFSLDILEKMSNLKNQPRFNIINFSDHPNFALKEVNFTNTQSFVYCKTGFELDYISVLLSNVPLYQKEDDKNDVIPSNVSDLALGYISKKDFLYWKSRVKILFVDFINNNHHVYKYINFDDIHSLKPDLYVNETLYITDIDTATIKMIDSIIQGINQEFDRNKKFSKDYFISFIMSLNKKKMEKGIIYVSYAYTDFMREKRKIPNFSLHKNQLFTIFDVCRNIVFNRQIQGRGKIYQIDTGEGKSCIIQIIAAFLVLMKKKVHISSSNITLCQRDYQNSYEFFKKLGMTTSILLHPNEKTPNDDKMNIYPEKLYGKEAFNNSSNMNIRVCDKKKGTNIVFSTFVNFESYYLRMMELFPGYIGEYFKGCALLVDEADSILIDELMNGTILSHSVPSNANKVLKYVYLNRGKSANEVLENIKEKWPECQDICLNDINSMFHEIDLVNKDKEFSDGKKYLIKDVKAKNIEEAMKNNDDELSSVYLKKIDRKNSAKAEFELLDKFNNDSKKDEEVENDKEKEDDEIKNKEEKAENENEKNDNDDDNKEEEAENDKEEEEETSDDEKSDYDDYEVLEGEEEEDEYEDEEEEEEEEYEEEEEESLNEEKENINKEKETEKENLNKEKEKEISNKGNKKVIFKENKKVKKNAENKKKIFLYKKIVPFDHKHKGVIEPNKEFSGFIQQFIAIKEMLANKENKKMHIKKMSMNYLYVSHPIFVNLYSNVCGFTGTIGNHNDKKIFNTQYQLTTTVIPRENPNYRVDFPVTLCKNITERNIKIVNEIFTFHRKEYPVLVIFQDLVQIADVTSLIKKTNKTIKEKDQKIKNINIFDGKNEKLVPDYIAGVKGAVSLGTNVCGRGTNIAKPVKPLHVICAYFTSNERVMSQAFGRTARQGQKGSVHVICLEKEFLSAQEAFDDAEIKDILDDFSYKNWMQINFIDRFKRRRGWIFDATVTKQKIMNSYIKMLRKTRINVNRTVACNFKFPICMSVKTFLEIQIQKIFSLYNCPNCQYTWMLFQKYLREMIFESFSLTVKKADNDYYSSNIIDMPYKNFLESRINGLYKTLEKYFPSQINLNDYNVVPTYMHIFNIVNSSYEKEVMSIFPKDYTDINKQNGNGRFVSFTFGFKPFSLLDESGAKIDNCDDDDEESKINYVIQDPELKYLAKKDKNSSANNKKADDKKSENNKKSDDKKADDKKVDDKKVDDKKADDKKVDDKKADDKKADNDNDKKADNKKADDKKPDNDNDKKADNDNDKKIDKKKIIMDIIKKKISKFFSITISVDGIFNEICNKINSVIGNKTGLRFFLRRTLGGCEFGVCFDIKIEKIEDKIDNYNLMFDKDPLLLLTINIKSIIPLLAGILIFCLVYIAKIVQKIFGFIQCFAIKLGKMAVKKTLKNVIKLIIKELIAKGAEKLEEKAKEKIIDSIFDPIEDFLLKILDKQIEKLKSDRSKEIFNSLKRIARKIDMEEIGEKVNNLFGGKTIVGKISTDDLTTDKFFKLGLLLFLCFASFMMNFTSYSRAISYNTEKVADEYDKKQDVNESFDKNSNIVPFENVKIDKSEIDFIDENVTYKLKGEIYEVSDMPRFLFGKVYPYVKYYFDNDQYKYKQTNASEYKTTIFWGNRFTFDVKPKNMDVLTFELNYKRDDKDDVPVSKLDIDVNELELDKKFQKNFYLAPEGKFKEGGKMNLCLQLEKSKDDEKNDNE